MLIRGLETKGSCQCWGERERTWRETIWKIITEIAENKEEEKIKYLYNTVTCAKTETEILTGNITIQAPGPLGLHVTLRNWRNK